MKKIAKFVIGAALASGAALAATAPADAGVHVGIGIGIPVAPAYAPDSRWCYYHPGACGPAYVGPAPAIGVFVAGRGYWDGHGWYQHRFWGHGGWRYR